MSQFPQRLGFDLADAFARNRKRLPDFFERMLAAVLKPKSHLDYFFFARNQRAQDLSRLVIQVHVEHRLGRRDHAAIFNEVDQVRIFLFANRRFQGDRLLRDLQHLAHFRHRNIHALGDFFRRRFAPQFLNKLPRGADQFVDRFDHVHRDADRTRLVGNRARNGLPNPPRRVRGKLIAPAVFEFIDCLHQADVAFLNQVEKLESAIGIFLGNRNYQSQVGLNQLALGLLRIHVALDDLALGALELLKRHAGFEFQLFNFAANRTRLPPIFFFLFFAAGSVGLALQVRRLAVERTHAVDRLIEPLNQPLALVVGEAQLAHRLRCRDNRASQLAPRPAMIFRLLRLRYFEIFFLEQRGLFVQLGHVVDLAREFIQAVLQDLVSDLFFIEGDHFLDRAHALGQVFAHSQQFANHDGRPRQGLEHTDLSALDALGDFYFAFSREQRHGSHLAQVHADGIVRLFQSTGGEVEFNVLAFLRFIEFFIERRRRQFGPFKHVDSLRTNRRQQIVQVLRRMHIVRDQIVYLVVGQVSLLFACVDQLFNVFELIVKSQKVVSSKLFNSAPTGARDKVP